MKISIAMATCNGARYLDAQLQSLLGQTRLPDELVVCDDASEDETCRIIERFAASASFPVRLAVNPKRLGLVGNFDRALSMATGDLVFPGDQDDVWFPEKLAVIAALAEEDAQHACFVNDAQLTDGDLREAGATKMQRIREAGLPPQSMVMGCCTAFRAALLHALLPIPEGQRAHDNWLVQMADLLEVTRRVDTPLQLYRRHGQNLSDYFVNRLDAPGVLARWRGRFAGLWRRGSRGGGLMDEYRFHAAAAERLRALADLDGIAPGNLTRARQRAEARAALLERRVRIRGLPRLRRPLQVAGLLARGGYRLSGGVAGAAKDLLLPRGAQP